jgi:hypothetical protein
MSINELHHLFPHRLVLLRFALSIAFIGVAVVSFAETSSPVESDNYRLKIESDWLRQERFRFVSPVAPITPEEDAVGGCDGVIDSVAAGVPIGYYGFHTDSEPSPWWQVRLDDTALVNRVVVYNASDPTEAKDAHDLQVLLSQDGETWDCVYKHDGTDFVGPKNPLTVSFQPTQTRFVRVQIPTGAPRYLRLEEIEVYSEEGADNLALHRPATQSSVCQYSLAENRQQNNDAAGVVFTPERLGTLIEEGRSLARRVYSRGGKTVESELAQLNRLENSLRVLNLSSSDLQENLANLFFQIKWTIHSLATKNSFLDFAAAEPIPPQSGMVVPGVHSYAELSVSGGDFVHFRTSSTVPYQLSICRLGANIDGPNQDDVLHTFPM